MASRNNAIAEITRFWLQTRHGCLVDEAIPVPVPYALSDIDLVAVKPTMIPLTLPDGTQIKPRLIVETKDEHDWEPRGVEFGNLLRKDLALMGEHLYIPKGTKGVKFTMLRQEHFEKATELFGTKEFERILVVHALQSEIRAEISDDLAQRGIYIVTIAEVVQNLHSWYKSHPRKAGLRHSLVGDLWHLLIGFCGCEPPG